MIQFILLLCFVSASIAFHAALWRRNGRIYTDSTLRQHTFEGETIAGDIAPVANYILVKVREAVDVTRGGIYMPDAAKERPTEGVVVAAGPGRVHPYTGVQLENPGKVGMNVIYGKYDGTELEYDGLNHQLIRDDDVLLVYEGKDATEENVKCVKDQVLILLDEKDDVMDSGLVVTKDKSDNFKMRNVDTGTVVKQGPGRQAGSGDQMVVQLNVGDRVKFRDFAGSDVRLGDKEYAVLRAYDILAKV